jgi:hypothetical protein
MNIGPWTEDEVALFRQLRADGLSMQQISARLNRSLASLQRKLNRLKLPHRTGHFQRAANPKQIKRAGRTTLPPLPSTRS